MSELVGWTNRLLEPAHLSAAESEQAISTIMDGAASPVEIAAFLTALRAQGESIDEVVGAARAMRARASRIPVDVRPLLDTCGTGGSGQNAFNISTATAIVVAACGVPVAKHGNRSATSASGSADALGALGVNLQLTPDQVALCCREVGIGFCFAPLLHAAMKFAAPVRKELGFRTIFNLLGPLTNPAAASCQLIGTPSPTIAATLAGAVAQLGTQRSLVVCGNAELGEVVLWGENLVFDVRPDGVREERWRAADFGLPETSLDHLRIANPAASAAVIQAVLDGAPGPARDVVLANAAAALRAADRYETLPAGVAAAAAAIDSGAAAGVLQRLIEWTQARAAPVVG